MNHLAIVRVLSAIALGFALLFAICFLVALATGERTQLMVFAGSAIAIGGLGGEAHGASPDATGRAI